MGLGLRQLRLWDQSTSVDNARRASVELTRARLEREEIDDFVMRALAGRNGTRSA